MDLRKKTYFSFAILLLCSLKGCNGVTCYDCVYVKRGDVLEAGLKGCADPFNKLAAIPTINCNGFCSKTVIVSGYATTITRTCLASVVGCSETNKLKCCDSNYCNGTRGLRQGQVAGLVTLVLTFLLTVFNTR